MKYFSVSGIVARAWGFTGSNFGLSEHCPKISFVGKFSFPQFRGHPLFFAKITQIGLSDFFVFTNCRKVGNLRLRLNVHKPKVLQLQGASPSNILIRGSAPGPRWGSVSRPPRSSWGRVPQILRAGTATEHNATGMNCTELNSNMSEHFSSQQNFALRGP